MHPIICSIGPFTVYSYGLMLALAFLIASYLTGRQAEKENIGREIIFNALFLAFICGIAGARLLYAAQNFNLYRDSPLEIIMLQHGGLSWLGGLISGSLCAVVYLKRKKIPVYKALDLAAPFAALGQAIGRIGCFLNGCCYGKDDIPVQLYSAVVLIFIFIILRIFQDRPHKEGEVFFNYLLLYSLKRFFIEFLRGDNQVIFSGLSLFQITSLGLFVFAFIKLKFLKAQK